MLLQNPQNDLDVLLPDRILPRLSGLVEGQVEEARLIRPKAQHLDRGDRLHFPNPLLQHQDRVAVDLAGLLVLQEVLDLPDQRGQVLVPVVEIMGRPAQEFEVAADLVVEDGDVARRLVRDEDIVLILVKLPQDPARRDHVVVRMRGEDDDALALREAAPATDLGAQGVEHDSVELSGGAVAGEKSRQVVLSIVDVVQLEHGLSGRQAEPDDGLDLERAGPGDLAQ